MIFSLGANAQNSVDGFGVLGGFTSSNTRVSDFDKSSVSQYHFGIAYKIPIVSGFAIQPELLYHVKGAKLDDADNVSDLVSSFETKTGYLELPVQIQWGPDMMAFRPYVFGEPFIGYQITSNDNGDLSSGDSEDFEDYLDDHRRKLEYGLGLGAGIEFMRFQLSVKYFWNFGNLYTTADESSSDAIDAAGDNVRNAFKDGKNFNGVDISLAWFF